MQDSGSRPPDLAGEQVQVVDLARGCRGIRRLIQALQHRGEDARRLGEDPGRGADVGGIHSARLGDGLRRPRLDRDFQLVEADGVRGDVVVVDPVVDQQLADESVHQGEVRARAYGEVHLRLARDLGQSWVDARDERRVEAGEPVEHPRPQHGLRLGHIVTEEEDRVTLVNVGVAAGLPVRPEASFMDTAAVAVCSRVLPSMCGVPRPALPMMPRA
jgi:hypothetical protein